MQQFYLNDIHKNKFLPNRAKIAKKGCTIGNNIGKIGKNPFLPKRAKIAKRRARLA